jgi:hypothetical protein
MPVRATTWLLLSAVLLAGIAKLALLPPFEGLDEAQYWSVIQQTADTGRVPQYREARLSQDVTSYRGPMPDPNGQPYRNFYEHANRPGVFDTGPTRFQPGTEPNYEAQHPPLFFLAMVVPYRLVRVMQWPEHFFVLRLLNWIIAFTGFALGALTTQRLLVRRGIQDARLLVPFAWPLLFAQFFEQFTRLTNDTLCLLLLALVWWLLIGCLEGSPTWRRSLALGVMLGAGLLTKAFFLPVTAGVALLVAWSFWQQRATQPAPIVLFAPAVAPAVALLIGGPWYLANLWSTGTLTAAADFIRIGEQGGLLVDLHAHFGSWLDIVSTVPTLYLAGLLRMLMGFC